MSTATPSSTSYVAHGAPAPTAFTTRLSASVDRGLAQDETRWRALTLPEGGDWDDATPAIHDEDYPESAFGSEMAPSPTKGTSRDPSPTPTLRAGRPAWPLRPAPDLSPVVGGPRQIPSRPASPAMSSTSVATEGRGGEFIAPAGDIGQVPGGFGMEPTRGPSPFDGSEAPIPSRRTASAEGDDDGDEYLSSSEGAEQVLRRPAGPGIRPVLPPHATSNLPRGRRPLEPAQPEDRHSLAGAHARVDQLQAELRRQAREIEDLRRTVADQAAELARREREAHIDVRAVVAAAEARMMAALATMVDAQGPAPPTGTLATTVATPRVAPVAPFVAPSAGERRPPPPPLI